MNINENIAYHQTKSKTINKKTFSREKTAEYKEKITTVETEPDAEIYDDCEKHNTVKESWAMASIGSIMKNSQTNVTENIPTIYPKTCEQRPRCISTVNVVPSFELAFGNSPKNSMNAKLTKGFSFRNPKVNANRRKLLEFVSIPENFNEKCGSFIIPSEKENVLPVYENIGHLTTNNENSSEIITQYKKLAEYMNKTYVYNAPSTPKLIAQKPLKSLSKIEKPQFLRNKSNIYEKSAPALFNMENNRNQETRKTSASINSQYFFRCDIKRSPNKNEIFNEKSQNFGYVDLLGNFNTIIDGLFIENYNEKFDSKKYSESVLKSIGILITWGKIIK